MEIGSGHGTHHQLPLQKNLLLELGELLLTNNNNISQLQKAVLIGTVYIL